MSISFDSHRSFGVEKEYNSFDRRDFKRNRLLKYEHPDGLDHVGTIIYETLKVPVTLNKHESTHNNKTWVLKPDSSCGIEVCSPVSKGSYGLKRICRVVEALSNDSRIVVDDRCGLHIHLDVSDCSNGEIRSILAHWIKAEPVFLDSMPRNRKRNRYCQQLGLSPYLSHDVIPEFHDLIKLMGSVKYHTMNTYHILAGSRKTLEVRIADGGGCLSAYFIKNWVRLLIHFVETCRKRTISDSYVAGDVYSGLVWLDPIDVFEMLGLSGSLSTGMVQVRNWFIARIKCNIDSDLPGVWSEPARHVAKIQIEKMSANLDLKECLSPVDMRHALYAPENQV